jgi:hypothetical protein
VNCSTCRSNVSAKSGNKTMTYWERIAPSHAQAAC